MASLRYCLNGGVTFAVISLLLIGCSRPKDGEVSRLNISIPGLSNSQSNGVQAFDQLAHLAINITGDGISQPIFFSWDSEKYSGTALTPPSSFQLDIPQGPNRLIQVLAVYVDPNLTSQMQFYYGDVVQTLSLADETANITVSSVGQGATIVSGRIAGRYFSDSTSGATGPVDIVYAPPSGQPAMIVDRSVIANGWFQFFGLSGAKLGYRLSDGTYLWGGPVDLSVNSFPVNSTSLRASLPLRQAKQWDKATNTEVWTPANPEIYIYGFFGASTGVSGKTVCRSSAPATTKHARSGDSTTVLAYSATTAPADMFQTNLPYIYVEGGTNSGAGSCATADLYNTQLKFNPGMLDNGNDNSAGFRIPFTAASGYWINQTTIDASTRQITGTLLPGIPAVMDKMVAYKKVGVDDVHSDFAPCMELETMGFTLAGDTLITSTAFSMNIALTSTEVSNKVMVALCPMRNGALAGRGTWIRGDMFNYVGGGGGGGGTVAATKVAILDTVAFTASQCGFVNVGLQSSTNGPATSTSNVTVNLTATGSGSAFYASSDPNCAGASISSVSIPSGMSGGGVYFRTNATTGTSISLTPTDASAALTSVPATVQVLATGNTTRIKFSAGSQTANVGTCLPISVEAVQTDGTVITSQTGPVTVSSAGATIYTDSGCTAAGSPSFTNGVAQFYVKGTTAGTAGLQATATISSINFLANMNISIVAASEPTHFTMSTPSASYLFINQCMPITVSSVNDANNLAAMTSNQVLTFSSAGAGAGNNFYLDSACLSPMTGGQIPISLGQTSVPVYFKPQNYGAVSVTANIATTTLYLSGSQNYTIGNLWLHMIQGGFNAAWYAAYPTCGSVTFQLMDNSIAGSGTVIPNLSGSSIGISMNTNSSTVNGGLYSASDCSDAVVATKSTAISTGTNSVSIYMSSLVPSGPYVSVVPSYSGSYSPIYQNGNTLTGLSFAWCPPLDGGGACPSSLALSGAGVGGGVANYGTVSVGVPTNLTITLTNTSGTTVTMGTWSITGTEAADYAFQGGSYPGTGGTCAASLGASASCTVVVTFTPGAVNGRYATLNIIYNGSVNMPLYLQGTGL